MALQPDDDRHRRADPRRTTVVFSFAPPPRTGLETYQLQFTAPSAALGSVSFQLNHTDVANTGLAVISASPDRLSTDGNDVVTLGLVAPTGAAPRACSAFLQSGPTVNATVMNTRVSRSTAGAFKVQFTAPRLVGAGRQVTVRLTCGASSVVHRFNLEQPAKPAVTKMRPKLLPRAGAPLVMVEVANLPQPPCGRDCSQDALQLAYRVMVGDSVVAVDRVVQTTRAVGQLAPGATSGEGSTAATTPATSFVVRGSADSVVASAASGLAAGVLFQQSDLAPLTTIFFRAPEGPSSSQPQSLAVVVTTLGFPLQEARGVLRYQLGSVILGVQASHLARGVVPGSLARLGVFHLPATVLASDLALSCVPAESPSAAYGSVVDVTHLSGHAARVSIRLPSEIQAGEVECALRSSDAGITFPVLLQSPDKPAVHRITGSVSPEGGDITTAAVRRLPLGTVEASATSGLLALCGDLPMPIVGLAFSGRGTSRLALVRMRFPGMAVAGDPQEQLLECSITAAGSEPASFQVSLQTPVPRVPATVDAPPCRAAFAAASVGPNPWPRLRGLCFCGGWRVAPTSDGA